MSEAPSFLEEMPLGGIRKTDRLFKKKHDGTCSRCAEAIAEDEVPFLLWLERDTSLMFAFCTRCAYDPLSQRCRICGCTQNHPCDEGCGWVEPNLCSSCVDRAQEGST